jgi:hypothetical protein
MTAEQFEAICNEIESTWEGLSIICPKHNVPRSSFFDYKDKNPDALDRYARAREKQLDYLEDLLVQISMNDKKDSLVDGTVNLGSNSIARDRLKADTLKFVLSKLRSNVWGTKIEHTIKSEPRVFKID